MSPLRLLCALMLISLLTACSAPPDENADPGGSIVTVTTIMPVRRTFHDTVEAWGSAVGSPQRTRAISLAHGGQIVAVAVAPGQTVSRGQALLTIRTDAATRSAYRQAQNALTLARSELRRTQQLAAEQLATRSQLATARKALADAEAVLQAQRVLGGSAGEQTVRAPADGMVSMLSIGLGERVAANAPLLSFTPAHALIGELGIQPEDGAKLRPGMPVHLRSVYGPAASFIGKLSMIGQAVNATTHLLPARVDIPTQAAAGLVVGAVLSARIQTAEYTAWAVPRAAVLHDDKGDYLFQVEHGHAKRVNVSVRHPDGEVIGVRGPLDVHARVIVLGVYELNDGDAVRESAQGTAERPAAGASG